MADNSENRYLDSRLGYYGFFSPNAIVSFVVLSKDANEHLEYSNVLLLDCDMNSNYVERAGVPAVC